MEIDIAGDLPAGYSFFFDGRRAPVRTVRIGERFNVQTRDAVNGKIGSESVPFTGKSLEPMSLHSPELSNPVYGPVYISGVRKGDLLGIRIHDIRPNPTGVTGIKVGQGLFHDSSKWAALFSPPSTRILKNDTAAGRVRLGGGVEWDLRPFIGTIGVAPESEIHASSVVQGPWGGNWDCRHIRKGATLHVNAFHDGGLLYVGDVHGSQGDGELSGIANEIESELELEVTVLSQQAIPYARIETDDEYICIHATKPLESAVSTSIDFLLGWLAEKTSLPLRDLYVVLSTCPEFRIDVYQMVDMPGISFTAGARFPKGILPPR